MQIGFIVVLIIAIFVAIFSIQNGDVVSLDLFLARVDMPLAVIIMVCIIIGAVLVLALGTTRQFKKRSESKEMKNKLKTLEGDKVLADKTISDLQQQLQALNEKNSELLSKISELEEKNKTQTETIETLNNELEFNVNTNDSNTINESVGTDLIDEKSEIESE